MSARSIDDLVRIAAAGGGFTIDAKGKAINDLVRIAAAAKNGGATITFRNTTGFALNDLVRIAAASGGSALLDV